MNSRYLKRIADDSIIVGDEIINATDSVSTKVTNTILPNVMTTVSMDSDNNKVRYNVLLYSAHGFISDYVTIQNCHYLLSLCKAKVKTIKGIVVLI